MKTLNKIDPERLSTQRASRGPESSSRGGKAPYTKKELDSFAKDLREFELTTSMSKPVLVEKIRALLALHGRNA